MQSAGATIATFGHLASGVYQATMGRLFHGAGVTAGRWITVKSSLDTTVTLDCPLSKWATVVMPA